VGIISARGRIWGKAVQTDAKVSPSNYGGPLVDLQGRVFGILVPLSPSSQHELAGAEWYDGGIGFAVPLEDVYRQLERMSTGTDLHPGILGVTLKSGDIYSLAAEIAACHPKSPAYQAGLRPGDTIVAVNGRPVERQSQLRHALGPLYAGEKVNLEALRGDERRSLTLELAHEIAPYEHPYLGILPQRGAAGDMPGVGVRFVMDGSGAAAAGIRVGDVLKKLGDREVAHAAALREVLAAHEPKQSVTIQLLRDGQEESVQVTLGAIPNAFPPAAAIAEPPKAEGDKPAAASDVKIPEEPNECLAYVPATYRAEMPAGLLIVLPPPGPFKSEEFTEQWSQPAEQFGLIVVAPQARMPNMWLPAETGLIRKVIDHFVAKYRIDPARIAVYGSGASGAMAYLTGFRLRDKVRGVIAVDAAIPLLVARPPDNDPVERLQLAVVQFAKSNAAARIRQNIEMLREMKYPVIVKEITPGPQGIDADTRTELLRWIDTLDQI
jgi:serine protease Do